MSDSKLAGIRVAVTRAREQADELAAPLRELGAEVFVAPLIRIEALIDSEPVSSVLRNLSDYDWLVLTSANGVRLFAEALRRQGEPLDVLSRIRVACVGPGTAVVAANLGIITEVIPEEFTGAALAGVLAPHVGAGARVLLARAAAGREQLPRLLTEEGAKVTEIELYRSVPDADGAQSLRQRIAAGKIDVITFTSGSTVRYFSKFVGQLDGSIVAVIGPSTAETARQYDIPVSIEASPHTTRGLAHAIAEYFRRTARPTEE